MKTLLPAVLTLCFFVLCSNSCNGPKTVATQESERSFIIGSGGGFTGAYKYYRVYNTGKVELREKEGEDYALVNTLPVDSAKACFEALDALSLADYNHNKPGNMSYYITIGDKTVMWESNSKSIRKDVDQFFKRSRKMIRADYN